MWCKKYSDIYKEIAKLNPKDTLQLVLESETEEEKDFYEMVWDFLLQRRQKEVMIIFQVERPLFMIIHKMPCAVMCDPAKPWKHWRLTT